MIVRISHIALPVRADPDEIGSIVDANDVEVCIVDQHRERDDLSVTAICAMIVDAINRAGSASPDLFSGSRARLSIRPN